MLGSGIQEDKGDMAMTYLEIFRNYQHDYKLLKGVIADHYARFLSPFFTMAALRLGIIPNAVTCAMILCGVIGAVLFCVPDMLCKVAGTVFIHFWYILDLSDGEVARITGRYSPYGTDIDYYAHVINHPLFIFAFGVTLFQYGYDMGVVAVAAYFYVSAELVNRHNLALLLSHKEEGQGQDMKAMPVYVMKFFVCSLCIFPNIALTLPVLMLVSSRLSFYAFVGLSGLNVLFVAFRLLKRIVFIVPAKK